MERKTASSEEIQRGIEGRIARCNAGLDDYAEIRVQLPERKPPDANGCNWDVAFVGAPGTSMECADEAAAQVKRLYGLKE